MGAVKLYSEDTGGHIGVVLLWLSYKKGRKQI